MIIYAYTFGYQSIQKYLENGIIIVKHEENHLILRFVDICESKSVLKSNNLIQQGDSGGALTSDPLAAASMSSSAAWWGASYIQRNSDPYPTPCLFMMIE